MVVDERELGMGVIKVFKELFGTCNTKADLNSQPTIVKLIAASRICVLPMTWYSIILGGVLAWLYGYFDPIVFVLVFIGFSLAHIADNILNDYEDYRAGIDTPDYFRALYGPHPFISGFIDKKTLFKFLYFIAIYNAALTVYLTIKVGILVLVLAVTGFMVMLSYAGLLGNAKKHGIGELLVSYVWGPVMIGGTFYSLTGFLNGWIILLSLSYGLMVSGVLIGKHLDKIIDVSAQDHKRGLLTLPARIGIDSTKKFVRTLYLLVPLFISLLLYVMFYNPLVFILLLSYVRMVVVIRIFKRDRPQSKPEEWGVWPLWYVAWSFISMDIVGKYLILALILVAITSYLGLIAGIPVFLLALLYEARKFKELKKYLSL